MSAQFTEDTKMDLLLSHEPRSVIKSKMIISKMFLVARKLPVGQHKHSIGLLASHAFFCASATMPVIVIRIEAIGAILNGSYDQKDEFAGVNSM